MKSPIELNQCLLYRCRSKKRLAEHLELGFDDIKKRSEWIDYVVTHEPKKNGGGLRAIYAPSEKLKATQRRILRLLCRIGKPQWVYSGTKGKSYVDNALAHNGRSFMVLTDIESFYERCTREMVYRFFRDEMQTSPDVAEILADLTTYKNAEEKSIIPSGSPCSQLLAYFAYREMFEELEACARRYRCSMSLYVDDITLSSDMPICNPMNLQKQMARITRAYGHRLKWRKTRYAGRAEYKLVTGVALDGLGEPHIPNRLGMNIMDGLHDSMGGDNDQIAPTLGRIGAARQIIPGVFPEVQRLLCDARSAVYDYTPRQCTLPQNGCATSTS